MIEKEDESLNARALDGVALIRAKLMDLRDFFGDNAQRMTCEEMESLVDIYVEIGEVDTAIDLLHAHADDDEEEDGDKHHGWGEAACAAWVANRIAERIESR